MFITLHSPNIYDVTVIESWLDCGAEITDGPHAVFRVPRKRLTDFDTLLEVLGIEWIAKVRE